MTDKTNKELYAELDALVLAAQSALTAAEKFANQNKLSFTFDPAYGMGGTFYPAGEEVRNRHNDDIHKRYRYDDYLDEDAENGHWRPSSHSC